MYTSLSASDVSARRKHKLPMNKWLLRQLVLRYNKTSTNFNVDLSLLKMLKTALVLPWLTSFTESASVES
ncbi:hypothetical protein O9992_18220 [Vibrio lentus]|nr:hypothetical protein [Vibrio lentus]